LVDPQHKVIRNDPRINWIARPTMKHRELRGLTSAGRHGRGLQFKKGHRANHDAPSRRAAWKRNDTKVFRRWR